MLVCEDCNNADTHAKTLLSQDDKINLTHQSFSIGQIQQFIRSLPHTPHQIDEHDLRPLWADVRPTYRARMKLILEVAKAAVTQDHWHERYPLGFVPVPTLGTPYNRQTQSGFEWLSADALQRAFKEKTSLTNQTGVVGGQCTKSRATPHLRTTRRFFYLRRARPGCGRN